VSDVQPREADDGSDQGADETADPRTMAEICHLVRTPLNGVLGTLELLIEGHMPDDSRALAQSAYDAAMAMYLVFEQGIEDRQGPRL